MDVRKLGLSDEDLKALGYKVPTRGSSEADGPGTGPAGASTTTREVTQPGWGAWLWTVVALLAVGFVALPSQRIPSPVPANQPDSVFSSGRAMSQLVEIARAPRPVGAPEHARVRAYLADRLESLGLTVEIQSTTAMTEGANGPVVSAVRNVVARRPGASSTGAVLLTAHYDGTPLSLGAGDNGIGLAAVLETVRALTARDPLRNDVVVLFSDAKELGSLGARSFLNESPWASDVRAVISVDARGVSGPAFLLESPGGGVALVDGLDLSSPGAFSAVRAMPLDVVQDTELGTLSGDGSPGLGLVALGGRYAHERPQDRPINVREGTLQHAGDQLLALTGWLGQEELGRVRAEPEATSAYLTLPLIGLVPYPAGLALPLTIALVVVLLLLFALTRARGDGAAGILAGVALGVVVVASGVALGAAVRSIIPGLHPEVGHLETAIYEEGLVEAALLGAILTILLLSYSVARRRYARHQLLVGASVLPVVATVALTFAEPDVLSLAQPPVLMVLLASLLALLLPGQLLRRGGRAAAVGLTWGVLLFAVPAVFLVTTTVTLLDAPWIAAWMALASLLLLPVAEWLLHPSPVAAPVVTGLAAVTALALSVPGVAGGGDHAVPTSLALLVDDTIRLPAQEDSTTRWMPARWLTVPGTGESWVMSWVVDEADRGASPGPLLLPASDRWVVIGSGPETFLTRPSVQILTDDPAAAEVVTDVTPERRVRLSIRPGLDAEMVGLRLSDSPGTSFATADGLSLAGPSGAYPSSVSLWGRPESEIWVVDVELGDDTSTLALDVVEHHLRPREILGDRFFQRADSVVADASTGSDRLIQRVRFRIPLP